MNYKKVFNAEISTFYDEEHYDITIADDAVGYKENGDILFIFKKMSYQKKTEKHI